jgi:hypothetical protein
MQMNEKVLTALEVLKDCAENDFERHRIDVLIKDLTDPPKVEIIDDEHQKFNGETYYLNTYGHYSKGYSIHQAVYRYYYGEIAKNYHVHHKNENKNDNSPENLKLLEKTKHQQLHRAKQITENCICEVCGKIYTSKSIGRNRFCSKKCSNYYHARHQQLALRVCPVCGKESWIPRGSDRKYKCCSKTCNTKLKRIQKIKQIIKNLISLRLPHAPN